MNITAKTKICMVIGDPVEHSLSPRMHNAGYEALGIDDQYVYIGCHVDISDIENFVKGVRAMRIRGISCTIPHKLAIMQYLDEIDDVAKKIGAVNTIINENGKLKGYNTDWIGIVEPLIQLTTLSDKKVALLGAGGAARAAAYAVTSQSANLMIFNRTTEKAKKLAEEFGGVAYTMNDTETLRSADIIINTTSVGLHPHENETPLFREYITNNQIVYDVVYTSHETTRLIKEAKEQEAQTISGIEMLLHQGYAQFKLFTGHEAPKDTMKKSLLIDIKHP